MTDGWEQNVFDTTAFKMDLGGDSYVKRVEKGDIVTVKYENGKATNKTLESTRVEI